MPLKWDVWRNTSIALRDCFTVTLGIPTVPDSWSILAFEDGHLMNFAVLSKFCIIVLSAALSFDISPLLKLRPSFGSKTGLK